MLISNKSTEEEDGEEIVIYDRESYSAGSEYLPYCIKMVIYDTIIFA